jgi:hypothetical protein
MTQRTKAQRRYRKQGYTWEIAPLRNPFRHTPKTIVIHKSGPYGWRSYRPHLLDFLGETIRPICKHYIHNGRKPR